MTPAAQLIASAILRCITARDGRGRWRAERELVRALGGRSVDQRCAAAAVHVAKVISDFPEAPPTWRTDKEDLTHG